MTELCLSCSPGPFRKAPGSSQSQPYVTRLAPSPQAGEFPSPSPVLRPLCPGAALQPQGEASWSLRGELTLAPHLGCTSLCAEVTSGGLPGGDIIPQAISDRQRPRLPGESLQGRVLRSWEEKRRALPL